MCLKQFEVNDSEIERIEDSLSRLREEFAEYRKLFEQAHESARTLLAQRARGFSNPFEAALHEQALTNALQEYFRLREQIDWWLEQVSQLVILLTKLKCNSAETKGMFLDKAIRESALRNLKSN
jgi:glycyl-tRNA synthetase beta subunit